MSQLAATETFETWWGAVDGSAFDVVDVGERAEAAGAPILLCATAAIAPPPPSTLKERLVQPLTVGLAAAAHLALLVALLPVEAEVLGDGGLALESVAVAIVQRVPVVSPPSAGVLHAPIEHAVDEAQQEAAEVAPAEKLPVEPSKPPEVVLDVPPDDAPSEATLPVAVKPPEPEPKPVPRTEREVEPPRQEPDQQRQAAVASAPEMVVAVAAIEASSGVVKAYESQLTRVIAARPPRPRGLKGRLVVELVIGTDGRPEATSVIEPSGRRALDAAVLDALQRLQFPVPPPAMTLKQRTFHQAFVYN
jgi:TonB family protein